MSGLFEKIFNRKYKALPGMDAVFFATADCDGCGECAERCPTGHIKMVDGRPVWPKPCFLCAACGDVCPNNAISYGTPEFLEKYWELVEKQKEDGETKK